MNITTLQKRRQARDRRRSETSRARRRGYRAARRAAQLAATLDTPADGDVSMRTLWLPEGPYELRLTKSHATWKRTRWPWTRHAKSYGCTRWPWTRHAKSYGWEVVSGPGGRTGLPVPGKGENSYDIDEDAIYGGGMAGDDPEEVVGKIGADVMRTRARRAGSDWRPEPRDAIEDLTESSGLPLTGTVGEVRCAR